MGSARHNGAQRAARLAIQDQRKPRNEKDSLLYLARTDPVELEAELIKKERTQFEERFRPNENRLLADLTNREAITEQAADDAGAVTREQFMKQYGASDRALKRAGVTLSGGERRAINKSNRLAEARAVSRTENTTRDAYEEMYTDASGDALNIGKGISGAAMGSISTAANAQREENTAQAQRRADRRRNTISTLATGAGLILGGL